MTAMQPTWNDTIEALLSQPYWINPADRSAVAQQWQGCMSGFGLDLSLYAGVKAQAAAIYHFLHSREMPLTSDPRQYWPDEALEQFRHWVNQGYRLNSADPIIETETIKRPTLRPLALRVRRDIRSLSQAELDDYRMRLDDVMQVGSAAPTSPAQIYAAIHSDWCLHYQEAFLLWHRAYLLQFEQQLGCAVPYWNWMAAGASVDGDPAAGLPQAFKDETYIHPQTKVVRPNPLLFAAARNGRSKACASDASEGVNCYYVQRDPLFYTTGDDHRQEREQKIAMSRIFQEQVVQALSWNTFSQPEGWPGHPWANITAFDPPQPDNLYPNRTDFDGLYEQPHDNYHGWIGGDMADNAYTAYDPIFWSYHANIDRIFEQWIRAHPGTLFTSSFPLHPFRGSAAEYTELDDPRAYVYTSIGDMAKDSRAIGFDYAPPVTIDFVDTAHARFATGDLASAQRGAYVVFTGIRCTMDSYSIDVFVNQSDASLADATLGNPHYIGRLSRIGMGLVDEKGRCVTVGVTRVLEASAHALVLKLDPAQTVTITLIVTELATGRQLVPDQYAALPGFEAQWVWGAGWPQTQAKPAAHCPVIAQKPTQQPPSPSCCTAHKK
jgi:Common central domain of tyrosinase